MAEEHPTMALSLVAQGKRSPGTTTAASVKRPATTEAERARRRTMSGLYAELGALLPGLPARAPRARVLEEAIAYVGVLRATVAELEVHKAVAAERSRASAGAAAGGAAGAAGVLASVEASCFAVRLPAARRPGSLTRVLEVFQRHGVAVLAATVASSGGEAAVTVTTTPVAAGTVERIKADIVRSIP